MTSSAAVVTLTYDGNDVQDIDGIFLDLYRGGPGDIPEVRGEDDVIPGLDGRVVRNRRMDRLTIELRGFVRGTGTTETDQREDYWDNRILLASWFDPTSTGPLVATLPGGLEFTIQARTLPPFVFNQHVPSYAEVSVQLESADPEWEQTGS
jgi:hypothetical protein